MMLSEALMERKDTKARMEALMALWGWARGSAYVFGEAALSKYPNVEKLVKAISERPAAIAATELAASLKVKTTVDEKTRRILFPQNV